MIIPQYAFAGTPGFATKRPSERQTICHSKLHRNTHAQHQTNYFFFQAESPFETRVLGAEISLQNPGREGLPKIFVAHLQRLQAGTQGTS